MNRRRVEPGALRERASATPDPRRGAPLPGRSRPDAPPRILAVADGETGLRATQLWFVQAVTSPEVDAAHGSEAELRLTVGPRLSAVERLAIYQRGYEARLLECLADDYPVLQHALGAETFDAVCRTYLARHPSRSPSLNFFGRHMTELCRHGRVLPAATSVFASELAALEWAIVEVIHAASARPLSSEGLADVPLEAWTTARLIPNPALRLLRFDYPVNAYFQAYQDGTPTPSPSPHASATAVYRSGPTVWRMDLTAPMFDVLSALVAGEPLAAALGRAETSLADVEEEEAVHRVIGWFREWVASGLFVRVDLT